MIQHDYVILSAQERSILRIERVKALEADLCRAELSYEDALSSAEKDSIIGDIQAFKTRLEVHYRVLSVEREEGKEPPEGN